MTVPAWSLAVARVVLGCSFLFSDHGSGTRDELPGFLTAMLARSGYGFYQAFLRAVVVPHVDLFRTLVFAGELFAGIALIAGFATRLASAVAIFLLANFLLAKGAMPFRPGIDIAEIALALVVMTGAAGRAFGADRFLARRFPRALIW